MKKKYRPSNSRKDESRIKCFGYNEMGHYANDPIFPSKKYGSNTNKEFTAASTTESAGGITTANWYTRGDIDTIVSAPVK